MTMRTALLTGAVAGALAVGAAPSAPPAAAQTADPATTPVPPGATAAPNALAARRPPLIDASAAAVYEPVTGDLVFAYHASGRRPIASTTKLMTAYVVLNRVSLGRVFVSPGYAPAFSDESLINLRAGEQEAASGHGRSLIRWPGTSVCGSSAGLSASSRSVVTPVFRAIESSEASLGCTT